jgi:hypothetical protein
MVGKLVMSPACFFTDSEKYIGIATIEAGFC